MDDTEDAEEADENESDEQDQTRDSENQNGSNTDADQQTELTAYDAFAKQYSGNYGEIDWAREAERFGGLDQIDWDQIADLIGYENLRVIYESSGLCEYFKESGGTEEDCKSVTDKMEQTIQKYQEQDTDHMKEQSAQNVNSGEDSQNKGSDTTQKKSLRNKMGSAASVKKLEQDKIADELSEISLKDDDESSEQSPGECSSDGKDQEDALAEEDRIDIVPEEERFSDRSEQETTDDDKECGESRELNQRDLEEEQLDVETAEAIS